MSLVNLETALTNKRKSAVDFATQSYMMNQGSFLSQSLRRDSNERFSSTEKVLNIIKEDYRLKLKATPKPAKQSKIKVNLLSRLQAKWKKLSPERVHT